MATVDSANPSSSRGRGGIRVEDLKRIDIGQLSQSELQALSLCSGSAFGADAVVSPDLDRSLFNESAGSRRQTYSRLHHRSSHSRLPGHHPSLKPHRHPHPSSDPVSHSIVHFLKHFLNGNHNPPPPPPHEPRDSGSLELQANLKIKSKRAKKNKMFLEGGGGTELQKVNCKGEVVDFAELEKNGDELYREELKRRTEGLETEEGILGFLQGLEGQWCSRRKKRKYVDASVFGDALPIGWKLLLGLRRCDYRVSVYCRRCISPSGQQFMSCKEAASFLKSYFGGNDVLSSKNNARPADKISEVAQLDMSAHSNEYDDPLMGIENLPEVQIKDIFECFKCKVTFDEKDSYLQHLFSVHQKTTKRYKIGTPVGEGVIIKDGKYECQFCHKVFDERRSYNGHVGIHVRNSVKNSNELAIITVDVQKDAESQLQEVVPLRSSKMDALVEIAQSSVFETSTIGTGVQAVTSSHPVEIHAENLSSDRDLVQDLNHGTQVMTENNEMVKNDYAWNLDIEMDDSCIDVSEPTMSRKYENSALDMGYGNTCLKQSEEIVFRDGVSSLPLAQSFQFFPPFGSVSDKDVDKFSVAEQKLENDTGFEELRFDEIEPFKYSFTSDQDLPPLPGGNMNLGNESGIIGDGFSYSVMLNTMDTNQLTVCVWCRTEFKLEGVEPEAASDSIGYMCPTCKTKISGHFSVGLSMDSHGF
ncbi:hypothetical protein ABFS82_02G058700 [Erythranthe guttata]|uniref:uncharacterized protein LOC105949566 n=1 Tax=Erythranthe guttata TaxID=4155 RepID=UPI00064DA5E6|nr:PREDICTED: uncharacterized protein LOC105949566 [Erythranthe guttata]|eukprot:XP_012828321.1 PREDICTED: uncharacterized protein LOC105949566 [Erythranthe guttata]